MSQNQDNRGTSGLIWRLSERWIMYGRGGLSVAALTSAGVVVLSVWTAAAEITGVHWDGDRVANGMAGRLAMTVLFFPDDREIRLEVRPYVIPRRGSDDLVPIRALGAENRDPQGFYRLSKVVRAGQDMRKEVEIPMALGDLDLSPGDWHVGIVVRGNDGRETELIAAAPPTRLVIESGAEGSTRTLQQIQAKTAADPQGIALRPSHAPDAGPAPTAPTKDLPMLRAPSKATIAVQAPVSQTVEAPAPAPVEPEQGQPQVALEEAARLEVALKHMLTEEVRQRLQLARQLAESGLFEAANSALMQAHDLVRSADMKDPSLGEALERQIESQLLWNARAEERVTLEGAELMRRETTLAQSERQLAKDRIQWAERMFSRKIISREDYDRLRAEAMDNRERAELALRKSLEIVRSIDNTVPAVHAPDLLARNRRSLDVMRSQPHIPLSKYETVAAKRTIYFATNRMAIPGSRGQPLNRRFLNDRTLDGTLTFGSCLVNIPVWIDGRFRSQGVLTRPGLWNFYRQDDPRVFFIDLPVLQSWDQVRNTLRRVDGPGTEGDVLLFVHGYNNSFEDATLRAAQLAHDTGFLGRTVLFSWPSAGSLIFTSNFELAYRHDERMASGSDDALFDLLCRLIFLQAEKARDGGPPPKVHVIAHSMGNRILLSAMRRVKENLV